MQRESREKLFKLLSLGFTFLAALPVFLVIIFVFYNGLKALSREFFTSTPQGFGPEAHGGIAHAIVGTLFVIIVGAFIGVPLGVLSGAFLYERRNTRLHKFIDRAVGAMLGTPSVVAGLVIYVLFVAHFGPSAFAGGLSLSLIIWPMVAESTRASLESVPREIREGGFALGAKRHQVLVDITIPAAWKSVLVGIILAVGRALGEAAPILFTAGYTDLMPRSVWDPAPTLPYIIYVYALYYPRPIYRLRARGASLVLLLLSLGLVYLSWRLGGYERDRVPRILCLGRR